MFCSKCGFQNADNVAFCQKCGNSLSGEAGASVNSQPVFNPVPQTVKKPVVRSSNPVLNTVKTIATSPLYLVAVIAFSISLFFDFISMLSGQAGIFSYIYGIAEKFDLEYELGEILYPIQGAVKAGTFIGMIPVILIAVGLWLIFVSALDTKYPGMKTAGLTMIKVINVIKLVFVCIYAGIIEIVSIIAIAQTSNSYSLLDDYGLGGVSSAGTGLLVFLDIITIAVFTLVILYYSKIISSINAAKNTINTATPLAKASNYLMVMLYILSGFSVISTFFKSGLGILTTLCSVTSMICFAILISRYNKEMRTHIGQSLQPNF